MKSRLLLLSSNGFPRPCLPRLTAGTGTEQQTTWKEVSQHTCPRLPSARAICTRVYASAGGLGSFPTARHFNAFNTVSTCF